MSDDHLSRYPKLRAMYQRMFERQGVDAPPMMDRKLQLEGFERMTEVLAPLLEDFMGQPPAIMDIGCGAGEFREFIGPKGARYFGCDLMPEFVEYVNDQCVEGAVAAWCGDAADLQFAVSCTAKVPEGVSWAVAINVFGYTNDVPDLYRRIAKTWLPNVHKGVLLLLRRAPGANTFGGLSSYPPDEALKALSLYGKAEIVGTWPSETWTTYIVKVTRG